MGDFLACFCVLDLAVVPSGKVNITVLLMKPKFAIRVLLEKLHQPASDHARHAVFFIVNLRSGETTR